MKKSSIDIFRFLLKMIIILIIYFLLILGVHRMTGGAPANEFYIAILVVFIYFILAIVFARISLRQEGSGFLKYFFTGMVIRILFTLISLFLIGKWGYQIKLMLLYFVPIYFVILMLESWELHRVANKTG